VTPKPITYYTQYVMRHLRSEFPDLVSDNCFVELMPSVLIPLCIYSHQQKGTTTGISFSHQEKKPSLNINHE